MEFNCGSTIIEDCEGVTVPYTDAGFQKFVGEAVSVATGAINIGLQMVAQDMSENMLRGLNAARCAIVSGGYSVWYFIASAWWVLSFVDQNVLLEDLLDEGYPHICTCLEDVQYFAEMLGGNEETGEAFSSCSEAADNV